MALARPGDGSTAWLQPVVVRGAADASGAGAGQGPPSRAEPSSLTLWFDLRLAAGGCRRANDHSRSERPAEMFWLQPPVTVVCLMTV